MSGQQRSQRGAGNQYRSGQSSVQNYGETQTDNTEYAQACSYVKQQLRAQIGDQRPAWDGEDPGFWDRTPPAQLTYATNQQDQHHQTSFIGQDQQEQQEQQQQQQQQQQGGRGYTGAANSGVSSAGTGMQQASGQYKGQQHQYDTNHHDSLSAIMPGPNSFAAGQPRPGTGGSSRTQHRFAPPSSSNTHRSRNN